jgi:hypothetical protein
MLDTLLKDPTVLGATGLLILAVFALYKGFVVPRWTYDSMLIFKEKEISTASNDCKFQREMNERLLSQLERTVTVAEVTANTASKVAANK